MEFSNYVIFARISRIPVKNGKNFQKHSSYLQNGSSSEKVFVMFWNTQQDAIQFETKFHRIPKEVIGDNRVPTKRATRHSDGNIWPIWLDCGL